MMGIGAREGGGNARVVRVGLMHHQRLHTAHIHPLAQPLVHLVVVIVIVESEFCGAVRSDSVGWGRAAATPV